jgi:SAM-dependent methyltransferase
MLDFARAASDAAAVPGITWLRGDAEDPPVPAGSVDFLLAANLIQFLPDPRAAARRWQQLLVKDGTIALAWGVTQDPVFAPVMAAMDAAVPAPALGFEAFFRRPPFDSGDGLTQLLTECGYDEAVTRHEPVVTVYEGPEQWWQASLGQAPWAVAWRHIPPADLRAARSEAFGLLEGIRGPDGKLTRTIGFGYTIARRRRR